MNPRLISLVFAPFAFGTSAFAFVGLIDPMAEDLGIGVPLAGQLQTVFAIAGSLIAIPGLLVIGSLRSEARKTDLATP